ncbi:MAG: hypothetical protein DLM71_09340 [Chloroflexi bacterium]|nr:MAG: hypothetical protein DLM71_09340 [Chloroflexota bacterium]
MSARIRWGEQAGAGAAARLVSWLRSLIEARPPTLRDSLPPLPAVLRRGVTATQYLAAERSRDHAAAAVAAAAAADDALAARAWWQADAWGHRALWHFERAEMTLDATRAARRIGEIRVAAGDPRSARRYYAEAISEARDIGAEHEEGLAAMGLGRAELELGNATTGRRLAQIALDLFERAGAPAGDVAAARELRGEEKEVG